MSDKLNLTGLNLNQRLLAIRALKANLEAEIKELNKLEAQAEQACLEFLADQALTSIKVAPFQVGDLTVAGATIYTQQTHWARLNNSDDPAAFDALRAAGLGMYIQPRVNTHSLSAWYREQFKEHENFELPGILSQHVTISSGFELRARKTA